MPVAELGVVRRFPHTSRESPDEEPEQKTNNHNTTVQPYLPFIYTATGSLVVGFFIGLWTDRLTNRREANSRRRTFRGRLRSISATLQSECNSLLYEAYSKTVAEVRDLCANIREDISCFRRRKLDVAATAYCRLTEPEVRVSQVKGYYDDSVTTAERDRRFADSRSNLATLVQRIIQCA